MPTTVSDYAQTAQEQTLKTVRQGQQAIIEGVRAWANTVEKSIPETPSLPYADELPSPHEIVQTGFEFAEQFLKSQRQFAEGVLEAASPVIARPAGKTKPAPKE
jgi:hypothetical protein